MAAIVNPNDRIINPADFTISLTTDLDGSGVEFYGIDMERGRGVGQVPGYNSFGGNERIIKENNSPKSDP